MSLLRRWIEALTSSKKTKPSATFGQTGTAPTARQSLPLADLFHELVEVRPRDAVRHVCGGDEPQVPALSQTLPRHALLEYPQW